MLSEPVRRVSFGLVNEATCQVGEEHSTQKAVLVPFSASAKRNKKQAISNCAQ